MTEPEAVEAIEAMFAAAWEMAEPTVPLALINEPLPSTDERAQLSVQRGPSMQRTTGGVGIRRVERPGWIVVKLWAKVGGEQCAARLAQLVQAARGILEMVDIPGPAGGNNEPVSTLADVGAPVVTDGRWISTAVRVPMSWYETK